MKIEKIIKASSDLDNLSFNYVDKINQLNKLDSDYIISKNKLKLDYLDKILDLYNELYDNTKLECYKKLIKEAEKQIGLLKIVN